MITSKLKTTLLIIIFLLGYTSLSFELLILRQLINFVGSNTLITSVVITFILLFMSVGYYWGSKISIARHPVRKMMNEMAVFVGFWGVISCSYYLEEIYFALMHVIGIEKTLNYVFTFSFAFLILPSICFGFITAVIGRIIHRDNTDYTGRFMAVDTMGSVSGSILTTLVFMPLVGVSTTIIILSVIAIIISCLLTKRAKWDVYAVAYIILLILSVSINNQKLIAPSNFVLKEDAISRIEIMSTDSIKGKPVSKIMVINGSQGSKISLDETKMFEYVQFIENNFIKTMPQDKPREILILGAGGFTVGLKDTFHHYTYVDIDKDLLPISEQYFLEEKLTQNKEFIVRDGYLFMLNNKKKYDIILVDVYSAVKSIPMNFVTADFFFNVKKGLKEDGIMIANIITSPNFKTVYSRRLDKTLRYVFPNCLERHTIQQFTPYEQSDEYTANVEYVYYNCPEDNEIFTLNKNSAISEK